MLQEHDGILQLHAKSNQSSRRMGKSIADLTIIEKSAHCLVLHFYVRLFKHSLLLLVKRFYCFSEINYVTDKYFHENMWLRELHV